jgi:hypothetical protein
MCCLSRQVVILFLPRSRRYLTSLTNPGLFRCLQSFIYFLNLTQAEKYSVLSFRNWIFGFEIKINSWRRADIMAVWSTRFSRWPRNVIWILWKIQCSRIEFQCWHDIEGSMALEINNSTFPKNWQRAILRRIQAYAGFPMCDCLPSENNIG